MEKFVKVVAVILLIGGIIRSLVNIEYALTGIFSSIAAFTLLYGFGMILGSVQRMEQSLSSLAEILRMKEREKSCSSAANNNLSQKQTASQNTASQKEWICPHCGCKNEYDPKRTWCKSCYIERGE